MSETLNRVEILEAELAEAAATLQATLPIGQVKAIGLREVAAGVTQLAEMLTASQAEVARVKGELSALIGYVSTARGENQPAWMEGLVEAINEAQASIGDPDRVRWDRRADWISVVAPQEALA